jgi:Flp pilus assembly pilin Flp
LLVSISVKADGLCHAQRCERTRTLSIQNGWLGQNNGKGSRVNLTARSVNDDSAATAIEYGLVTVGMVVAIIAAVNGSGLKLNGNSPRSTAR